MGEASELMEDKLLASVRLMLLATGLGGRTGLRQLHVRCVCFHFPSQTGAHKTTKTTCPQSCNVSSRPHSSNRRTGSGG